MDRFLDWIAENHPPKCQPVPSGILQAVQRSGPGGITRKELGSLFDLDGKLLTRRLLAYAGVGQITVARENGTMVFRAVW